MPDLVTQDYLTVAIGDVPLTAAQRAILPALAAAASRAIRRHCNRQFTRQVYDGLYTLDWPARRLSLRQYPVNQLLRVRTNPTPVLTVYNADTTTNQMATVLLILAGVEDVDDVPAVASGITLFRMASAVTTTANLTFAANPTMAAMAAAVTALGGGWVASVVPGFELWPTADFRTGQGPQPALGFRSQVGLVVHADDLPCRYDARAGTVELGPVATDPFSTPRWGYYLQTDVDDVSVYGGDQGVRVLYDAGWDTIPEDVQDACAETVMDWMFKKTLDQNLGSESDGARSYVLNTAFANYAFPKSVLGKLARYRSPRA